MSKVVDYIVGGALIVASALLPVGPVWDMIALAMFGAGASMVLAGVELTLLGNGLNRAQGLTVTVRDPNAAWRVAYGFTRFAGVPTFAMCTGNNNQYIHLVFTLCSSGGSGKAAHAIPTMYFDGTAIPLDSYGNGLAKWQGYVHAEFDLGDPTNSTQPFPGLAAALPGYWTNAHLQRGHAKVYVQLKRNIGNDTLFQNGVPNITFDVQGRELYDPRTTTTGYSTNPALCIRDFLTNPMFGLQADASSEINDTSFIAAANVCDQTVTLKGTISSATVGNNSSDGGSGYAAGNIVGVNGGNGDGALWVAQTNASGKVQRVNVQAPGSGYSTANEVATTGGGGSGLIVNITCNAGTEPQYTANGVFETSQTPQATLDGMTLGMAGYLSYIQGQFNLFAGAYATPTVILGDADFRAPIEYQTRASRRDIFNCVHGSYLSVANNWQASDYPAVQDATGISEDGIPLWQQLDLPFTTSASMAQRIATIVERRARRQGLFTGHFKLTAGMVQPCDTIQLNHARFSWTNKTFFVREVSLLADKGEDDTPVLGIDLLLQETDSNIYAWTSANEIGAPAPATGSQLPTASTATQPANVKAYGAQGNGKACFDAHMTASSAVLTSNSAPFSANDVGAQITVELAGASGADLYTTIASYQSANQVTLAAAALTPSPYVGAYWGGTDDTAAIQAAINACAPGGMSTVEVPPGVYLVSAALTYNTAMRRFFGHGKGVSIIKSVSPSVTALHAHFTDASYFSLEDTTFAGPGMGAAGGGGVFFDFNINSNIESLTVDGVEVRSVANDAFAAAVPIVSNFTNSTALYFAGNGFNVYGGATTTQFTNCYALTGTKAGFTINGSTTIGFDSCAAEGCGKEFEVINSYNVQFSNCDAEQGVNRSSGYLGHAYYVSGGSQIHFDHCSSNSVPTTSSRHILITGNAAQVTIDGQRIIEGATTPTYDAEVTSGCKDVYFMSPNFPAAMLLNQSVVSGNQVGINAGIDPNGNVILKNIADPLPVTSGPSTTSVYPTFVDLADMQTTAVFKGNKVLVTATVSFNNTNASANTFFQIARDGVSVGPVVKPPSPIGGQNTFAAITFIDTPAAGSHTYKIQWCVSAGTATSDNLNRSLQVVELG